VATSTVQLTRSLGGTVGVTVLGAYLTNRLAGLLGTSGAGGGDISALLTPQGLATLGVGDVAFLRGELGDAIRTLFWAGAAVMTLATILAMRIEEIPVVRRRSHGAAAPAVPSSEVAPLGK
jgi:hypothetical protein